MSTVTLINCSEVPPARTSASCRCGTRSTNCSAVEADFAGHDSTERSAPGPADVDVAGLRTVDTWQSIVSSPEFGALAARMGQFHPSPGRCTVETARTLPSAEPV